MQIKAAVIRSKGGPFIVEDVELDEPRDDEILVKVVAAGMCHSDLNTRDQNYPPKPPVVVGHEGAGVVEAVGRKVSAVKPGDRVVLTYNSCEQCFSCQAGKPWACEKLFELHFGGYAPDGRMTIRDRSGPIASGYFGQSSFATYALAYENNCVKVPAGAPLELAGPLGCGIQTGAGAVLNALQPPAGETIVIFGAGSVGLSAVMGAVIAGAGQIIAVDVKPGRLELAGQLGATAVVNAATSDPLDELKRLTGGGVRYVLEASGAPRSLGCGIKLLKTGGMLGLVGAPPIGTEIPLDVNFMIFNRTIRGIVQGYSDRHTFIPRLLELHRAGRFPFDKLIRHYDFKDINQAALDSDSGVTIKPVLRME
ncbi:MAG TPA: NAD(P)-dependent alcohol dehydrogenase [Candidatus Binataceae bacterium]|nr:NAD(P)-dependent alcohol dehydrogenase [Candidatus Binataceae bacterium]